MITLRESYEFLSSRPELSSGGNIRNMPVTAVNLNMVSLSSVLNADLTQFIADQSVLLPDGNPRYIYVGSISMSADGGALFIFYEGFPSTTPLYIGSPSFPSKPANIPHILFDTLLLGLPNNYYSIIFFGYRFDRLIP